MGISVKLLGIPAVLNDNKPALCPLRKAWGLFYCLSVEKQVTKERLAELFWSDKNDKEAMNNLRNGLYLLRKALPGVFDEFKRSDELTLARHVVVDIDSIELMADPQVSIATNQSFVLLDGFTLDNNPNFDEWLQAARLKISKRILLALQARSNRYYDLQDDEGFILALKLQLNIDPYNEDITLELMEHLASSGERTQALEAFRVYETTLKKDLNLQPSSRAYNFLGRLLSDNYSALSLYHTEKHLDPTNYFFARERELSEVAKWLDSDRQDRKRVVFVHGEAGVGKTSFMDRVLLRYAPSQNLILRTHAWHSGQSYPYAPWNYYAAELKQQGGSLENLGLFERSILAGVFPAAFATSNNNALAAEHLSLTEKNSNPVLLGSILARLTKEILGSKSLILFLEDLHYFDRASIEVLESLLINFDGPLTLLITCRPEAYIHIFALLHHLKNASIISLLTLHLSNFTADETLAFCRLFLREETIKIQGPSFFYNETAGLPLFLAELVASLSQKTDLVQGKIIPGQGLLGVVTTRLEELSEIERRLLEILSLFPDGATVDQIIMILPIARANVLGTIERLLAQRIIRERFSGEMSTRLEFQHECFRECVHSMLPSFRSTDLHRQVANLLMKDYEPQSWNPIVSSSLAYHLSMAGLHEQELECLLKEMVFNITLNHDLFPLVQDPVLMTCSTPFSGRTETEMKMARARDLLQTLNAKRSGGHESLALEASYLELQGGYLISWGDYDEGRPFIDRALAIAESNGFYQVRLYCLKHLCYHALQTDCSGMLLEKGRSLLRLAKKLERRDYAGLALRFIGVAMQLSGDFERARIALHQSISVFNSMAKDGLIFSIPILAAQGYIAEIDHWQGKLENALSGFELCAQTCEEKHLLWGCSYFHSQAANVAFDLNRWDILKKHVDCGVKLFENYTGGRSGSILYSLKALVEGMEGHWEMALRDLELGDRLSRPIHKKTWTSVQLLAQAFLARLARKTENNIACQHALLSYRPSEYAQSCRDLLAQIPIQHRLRVIDSLL